MNIFQNVREHLAIGEALEDRHICQADYDKAQKNTSKRNQPESRNESRATVSRRGPAGCATTFRASREGDKTFRPLTRLFGARHRRLVACGFGSCGSRRRIAGRVGRAKERARLIVYLSARRAIRMRFPMMA